ncbi:taurine catabolism dioxygenase TauD [Verticillium alfalfae VaMs.102]|uniref:Taurine catabolism dioxygenase TauD n=1 Tax=Verticillium alfalfae (strain VaMs.102 / ATCC MYA-4576 / FGSC 10136) TaxID=526221 RepID=C9S5X1_VERA1|nr:taurine catabolism dioxygenase TauD [Verticillium alfalfae VaMs.102]EEY15110.1 taurine catabolism dioxygenase TauD [Verticillium alfalfae VaMs.102]
MTHAVMTSAVVVSATDSTISVAERASPGPYYSSGLRARFKIDAGRPVARVMHTSPQAYAKIGYDVDEAAYLQRSKIRHATGGLATTLPEGWPEALDGPLVWSAGDLIQEHEYMHFLTAKDKLEIADALCVFKEYGLDGNEVSRGTFPLPSLGLRLDKICADIYEGRGFAIVRGLDPDEYSVEDLTIVYLGISSYIGERRGKQDQRGSMLMHVIKRNDEGRDVQYSEDKVRIVIASSWTVYNELAATRPDLIEVLSAADWPFDTFGRDPKFYRRPLLFYHHGKLIISFSRRLLVGHEPFDARTPGIPGLTEAQAEALDAVHIIARKHEMKPRMERGDLRFINNMSILHRREAFENTATASRHLVRIWLNNEMMCWKLPRSLRLAWARVFEDDEREEHWDIVPPMKDGKVLRVAGTCD